MFKHRVVSFASQNQSILALLKLFLQENQFLWDCSLVHMNWPPHTTTSTTSSVWSTF